MHSVRPMPRISLDYAQPLDRLKEPVAMISQLNYMKPADSTAELGTFQGGVEWFFKK
jgi:hypothetical protein